MARRRRLSRRKRTGYFVVGMSIATGLAAVLLWPKVKTMFASGTITVGQPTLTPATVAALLE